MPREELFYLFSFNLSIFLFDDTKSLEHLIIIKVYFSLYKYYTILYYNRIVSFLCHVLGCDNIYNVQ